MTQAELNRAVAQETGESVSTIASLGFVPLTPVPYELEPDFQTIDWDEFDAERNVSLTPRRTKTPVVA